MTIARFGFSVSLGLYVLLLLLEYLRPGFVSTAMNVHVILLGVVGFIVADAVILRGRTVHDADRSPSLLHQLTAGAGSLIVGIILALVAWSIGSMFGDFRLLFSLAIGGLTLIVLRNNYSL